MGEPDYAKHWAAKLTARVIEEQRAIIAVLDVPGLKAPRARSTQKKREKLFFFCPR